jgi:hypothetical protein
MNDRQEIHKNITTSFSLWFYKLQRDSKLAFKTRKELEVQLITRALKDEDFKQELLAEPKAMVEKELNTKLPEYIDINVFEETENLLYLVLPSNPYYGLAESELKASLGMDYEDIAHWLFEQHKIYFLDETSSVAIIVRAWKDEVFKQELIDDPIMVIEQEFEENIQERIKGIKLQVLVENATTFCIVLPKFYTPCQELMINSELNIPMVVGSDPRLAGPKGPQSTRSSGMCIQS